MVFMGDTGSLSMGGTIGAIAVATKHELILIIIGGIFVLEALSVFAQVISFKLTGKRIFRMAPIHHHFEQKGWSESTIVIRFWIIAIILALIGLASLKIEMKVKKLNKKILIFGLGISGISIARFLKNRVKNLFCWDDKLDARKRQLNLV